MTLSYDLLGRPILTTHGGPGSGDFGHGGRPGEVGGSEPGEGGGATKEGHGEHGEEHEDPVHDPATLAHAYNETKEISHLWEMGAHGKVEAGAGYLGGLVSEKIEKMTGAEHLAQHIRDKIAHDFGHAAPYLMAGAAVIGWKLRGGIAGMAAHAVAGALTKGIAGELIEHTFGGELGEKIADKASEVFGDSVGHALPYIAVAGLAATWAAGRLLQLHHIRNTAIAKKLGTAHEYLRETRGVKGIAKAVHTVHEFREKYIDKPIATGIGKAAELTGKGLRKASEIGEQTAKDLASGFRESLHPATHNVLGPAGTRSLLFGVLNAAGDESDNNAVSLHANAQDLYFELFSRILDQMTAHPDFQRVLNDPQERQAAVAGLQRFAALGSKKSK